MALITSEFLYSTIYWHGTDLPVSDATVPLLNSMVEPIRLHLNQFKNLEQIRDYARTELQIERFDASDWMPLPDVVRSVLEHVVDNVIKEAAQVFATPANKIDYNDGEWFSIDSSNI